MTNIQIRTYLPTDYNNICKLWNQLNLGGSHRGDNQEVIERTIDNEGVFFVMYNGNRLIGTAWITNDLRRLYLHHMGIDKDYQNRGLGKQLLNHCIQWSKTKALQLKLEVHPQNPSAVHLYQKAGFKKLGDYNVYIIRNYDNLQE